MVLQQIVSKFLASFLLLLGALGLVFALSTYPMKVVLIDSAIAWHAPLQQFLFFVMQTIQGKFGTSIQYGEANFSLIVGSLFSTLNLLSICLIFIVIIGLPLACFSRFLPLKSMKIAGTRNNIPYFMWCIALLLLYNILPTLTPVIPNVDGYFWLMIVQGDVTSAMPYLRQTLLPIIGFSLPASWYFACYTKKIIHDYRSKSYVAIKEMSRGTIAFHQLLFVIFKKLSWMCLRKSHLLFAHIIIVESIFNYHGIGLLSLQSAINQDKPLALAILLLFTYFYCAIHFLNGCLHLWQKRQIAS